jgi:hypothetical protein
VSENEMLKTIFGQIGWCLRKKGAEENIRTDWGVFENKVLRRIFGQIGECLRTRC